MSRLAFAPFRSTKEIAAHPLVSLKAGHVNVLLHRAREAMRTCMRSKGHEPRDMPVGTFVELWKACRLDEAADTVGARA